MSLGDQPEQQSLNYIMGGNSKFSARFDYLGNIEEIQLHLPSCKRCLRNIQSNPTFLLVSHVCEICVCWDVMNGSQLNNHGAPKYDPVELLGNDNSQLKFKELSFKSLKEKN